MLPCALASIFIHVTATSVALCALAFTPNQVTFCIDLLPYDWVIKGLSCQRQVYLIK